MDNYTPKKLGSQRNGNGLDQREPLYRQVPGAGEPAVTAAQKRLTTMMDQFRAEAEKMTNFLNSIPSCESRKKSRKLTKQREAIVERHITQQTALMGAIVAGDNKLYHAQYLQARKGNNIDVIPSAEEQEAHYGYELRSNGGFNTISRAALKPVVQAMRKAKQKGR